MKPGKIVVTGAAGFIGRRLVSCLAQQQREVTLLVRNVSKCPSNWRDNSYLQVVEVGAIESSTNLCEAIAGASTVVHLAGLAHLKSADPKLMFRANARATELLVHAAIHARIKTFVHLSSIAAITNNMSNSIIDDTIAPKPFGSYGLSKRQAEIHVSNLKAAGIFAVSIRPPLVVGSDAPGNWRLLQKLAASTLPLPFESVRNRRSYIGIETLIRMLVHLCDNEWATEKSGNYCVASADRLSTAEVILLLRQGMGRRSGLFPISPIILNRLLVLLGRSRIAYSLLGDLQVSGVRFDQVFDFKETERIQDEIFNSGRQFARG